MFIAKFFTLHFFFISSQRKKSFILYAPIYEFFSMCYGFLFCYTRNLNTHTLTHTPMSLNNQTTTEGTSHML